MLYPNLFSPITIRGKTFRNRILVAPLGAEIPDEGADGKISDTAIEFYRRVAHGGCARVMTGENDILFRGAAHGMYPFCEGVPTEAFKDSFRRYAKACHDEGALAFTSFGHLGVWGRTFPQGEPKPQPKQKKEESSGRPPLAVSYIPKDKNGVPYSSPTEVYGPSEMILEMPWDGYSNPILTKMHDGKHILEVTREQMDEFADALVHCALVAKECGLDGINIHSGHGFMFAPWLSERFNKRTDEFGGSFENRCRFPIMVLQRVREAVGEDFILEMRWSGEENARPVVKDEIFDHMISIEDSVRFFRELDKYPGLLDIAHISGGLHYNMLYNSRTISNFYFSEGLNLEAAAKIKAAVKNIRVGVVGGMTDPELCERAIAEGKTDFVIMARQLLVADPSFASKAEAGHPEDINNCMRCAGCRVRGHCTVNPVNLMTASAEECESGPDVTGKKLVVVGGGIGGMKAAEFAAERGFAVTLFEKESELGGILRYADHERFKSTLRRYKDNVIGRLERLGIDIRLGQAASAEDVAAESPDAVIVAVGGKPAPAAFPCSEDAPVLDVTEAYLTPEKVGDRVVIVGGGLSGCEAAIHWGDLGKKVTLLSRAPTLLKRFIQTSPLTSLETYLVMLDNTGVDVHTSCACTGASAEGVTATGPDGDIFFAADTVILASGILPVPDSAEPFRGTAPTVLSIGDSEHPGLVSDATWDAWQAVRSL